MCIVLFSLRVLIFVCAWTWWRWESSRRLMGVIVCAVSNFSPHLILFLCLCGTMKLRMIPVRWWYHIIMHAFSKIEWLLLDDDIIMHVSSKIVTFFLFAWILSCAKTPPSPQFFIGHSSCQYVLLVCSLVTALYSAFRNETFAAHLQILPHMLPRTENSKALSRIHVPSPWETYAIA